MNLLKSRSLGFLIDKSGGVQGGAPFELIEFHFQSVALVLNLIFFIPLLFDEFLVLALHFAQFFHFLDSQVI